MKKEAGQTFTETRQRIYYVWRNWPELKVSCGVDYVAVCALIYIMYRKLCSLVSDFYLLSEGTANHLFTRPRRTILLLFSPTNLYFILRVYSSNSYLLFIIVNISINYFKLSFGRSGY